MSAPTLPPPQPPVCLQRTYMSRGIKGGTIIAEDVRDFQTHRRLLLDPDGYRSYIPACRTCGQTAPHAHCFRDRTLRPASPDRPLMVETIRLYYCPGCGAVFTVLPALIARHLWRQWKTVEEVSSKRTEAPRTTMRRWFSRLASSAGDLVQAFLAVGSHLIGRHFSALLAAIRTRGELAMAARASASVPLDHLFGGLAGWIHRLQPGLRLM